MFTENVDGNLTLKCIIHASELNCFDAILNLLKLQSSNVSSLRAQPKTRAVCIMQSTRHHLIRQYEQDTGRYMKIPLSQRKIRSRYERALGNRVITTMMALPCAGGVSNSFWAWPGVPGHLNNSTQHNTTQQIKLLISHQFP